jgi:hypothetical protein
LTIATPPVTTVISFTTAPTTTEILTTTTPPIITEPPATTANFIEKVIREILNQDEPILNIAEMEDYVLTEDLLQTIAESGRDIDVVIENGFVFTIIADSITENARSFDLNIDISLINDSMSVETSGGEVNIPANSIKIAPNFNGYFGFELSFTFTAEQLTEADIHGNTVGLFHVSYDGIVTNMGRTMRNDDGSVTFTIRRASFFIISEESPVVLREIQGDYEGCDGCENCHPVTTAAETTVVTEPATTEPVTTAFTVTESTTAELITTEPDNTGSATIEPTQTESAITEPTTAESITTEPITTPTSSNTTSVTTGSVCECLNCIDCGFYGGKFGFGRVTNNVEGIVIQDALAILRELVGLSSVVADCENARAAAAITYHFALSCEFAKPH